MFIELGSQIDSCLSRPYDQVIWPRLNVVHDFQRVWFDLACIGHIPHEIAMWENNDRTSNPVMVDKEVTVLQTKNFHVTIESLMCWHLQSIELLLESFSVKFRVIYPTGTKAAFSMPYKTERLE